jgi:hypothetical protein
VKFRFGQTEFLGQGGKFFAVGIFVVISASCLIEEVGGVVVREARVFGVMQGDPLAILTTARQFPPSGRTLGPHTSPTAVYCFSKSSGFSSGTVLPSAVLS